MAVGYALYHRQRTGVGQHIDLSMIEGCLFADSLVMPHVAATKGENMYFRNGKQNTYSFPMGVLKSKEGYLVIHADGEGPESPWARLCGAIGRRDMIEDPRYASPRARVERTQEVIDILEGWLQTVSDDEAALTVLAGDRGAFQTIDYPELGPIEVVSPPYKFSETPARVRGPSPQLGEHSYDVLGRYLGLSSEEVEGLAEQGVLLRRSSRNR